MLSRLLVAVLWMMHFLPLSILARIGNTLGIILFSIGRRRRHIVMVNLGLCFPELDSCQHRLLAKAHFGALGRSMLERSLLWWASPDRLSRLIHVVGEERIRTLLDAGRPVLLLAPHFVGLDAGGVGIAMRFDSVSIYAVQSNAVLIASCYVGAGALAISFCSLAMRVCGPALER